MGYEVPRNPMAWVGVFLFGVVLIPFALFIYPVILVTGAVWTYFGARHIENGGLNVRVAEGIVSVYSNKAGVVCEYEVAEIEKVFCKFDPPFMYPVLLLRNGEKLELRASGRDTYKIFRDHGVSVDERPNIDA